MKSETLEVIKNIAAADPEASPEQIKNILAVCKSPVARRATINARIACELLNVSRPTLRRFSRSGLLSEIKLSARKIRFDKAEVERLAYNGIQPV